MLPYLNWNLRLIRSDNAKVIELTSQQRRAN